MSFHSGQTFVFGETPSASKMQYLWDNDYALADGSGISNDAIVARHLEDGAVLPEALVAGAGTSWAWQSWTPTWTNLTVGNGTEVAKYCIIGETVLFRYKLTFGTTTAITGSDPRCTPPVAHNSYYARVTQPYIGNSLYFDASAPNYYTGYVGAAQTDQTKMQPWVHVSSGTYGQVSGYTTSVPVAFGTGDEIQMTGMYERS